MKKMTALFLSFMMIFALAACGSQDSENSTAAAQPSTETTQGQPVAPEEAPAETPTEAETETSPEVPTEDTAEEPETTSGKTLVVYFSATGNTEEAANYIAAAAGAELFELEPAEPYSDEDLDWTDNNSRVVYEHDNPDARDVELVESTVSDWESYDTVFIGYPIWWGIAAWPVDSFIEANDFTGKTVIPFCTSASSGLGESGERLAQAAGTGTWLEGIRFSSSVSEDEVQTWVDGLGL